MAKPPPRPAKAPAKAQAKRPVSALIPAPTKRPGPKPHAPSDRDRALVKVSVAIGQTQEQIAKAMGLSKNTLRLHYAQELEHGAEEIGRKIAGNLAAIAMSPTHPRAVIAAMFWLKSRHGWRDGHGVTVQAEGGAAADAGAAAVRFTIKIGDAAGPGDADA